MLTCRDGPPPPHASPSAIPRRSARWRSYPRRRSRKHRRLDRPSPERPAFASSGCSASSRLPSFALAVSAAPPTSRRSPASGRRRRPSGPWPRKRLPADCPRAPWRAPKSIAPEASRPKRSRNVEAGPVHTDTAQERVDDGPHTESLSAHAIAEATSHGALAPAWLMPVPRPRARCVPARSPGSARPGRGPRSGSPLRWPPPPSSRSPGTGPAPGPRAASRASRASA